ncbi:MAG: M23 family metallopeptidase [Pseudomonadota bacterium]
MTKAYNPGSGFTKSSNYGRRIDPITGIPGTFHSGQDFRAKAGTPIPAAASGVVVYSGFNEGLGNVVIVKNDTGKYSLYGHMLNGDRVELGRRIWQGDTIGLVGSTGKRTTGNHLHYSVITSKAGESITGKDGGIGPKLIEENTIDPADMTIMTPRRVTRMRQCVPREYRPVSSILQDSRPPT